MKKLKVLIISLIVISVIGAGAFFYLEKDVFGDSKSDKGKTIEDIAKLSIYTDVITTNLASANNFAIIQFNILLSSEETKIEAENRTAEVRAAIISTMASFTKDQLAGKEGLVNLEQELSSKLGNIVQTGKVERVLVTEFKVQ